MDVGEGKLGLRDWREFSSPSPESVALMYAIERQWQYDGLAGKPWVTLVVVTKAEDPPLGVIRVWYSFEVSLGFGKNRLNCYSVQARGYASPVLDVLKSQFVSVHDGGSPFFLAQSIAPPVDKSPKGGRGGTNES